MLNSMPADVAEEKVKSLRKNFRGADHPKTNNIGNKKHQHVC